MKVEYRSVGKRLGLLVGASLLAGVCLADEGPKYTYIEGGYSRLDIDDFDGDGDIFGAKGSVALTDMLHLVGSYEAGEVEDVDLVGAFFGLGVNIALNETVDFVAQAGVAHQEIEFGQFDEDDQGLGANAGVRAMLTPVFELNGGVRYVDVGDDDETSVFGGAVYNFTDMFAGTAGVEIGDDATRYGIGVRLYLN
jgi:hypothetical protein